jgi:hypothetical protein
MSSESIVDVYLLVLLVLVLFSSGRRGRSFTKLSLEEMLNSHEFKAANGLPRVDDRMMAITTLDVRKLFINFFIKLVMWGVTSASLILTDMLQFDKGFTDGGLHNLKALYASGDAQTVYARLQGTKGPILVPHSPFSGITGVDSSCVFLRLVHCRISAADKHGKTHHHQDKHFDYMSLDYVFRHYLHVGMEGDADASYKVFRHATPASASCREMGSTYVMRGVVAAYGSQHFHNFTMHEARSVGTVLSCFSTRMPQLGTLLYIWGVFVDCALTKYVVCFVVYLLIAFVSKSRRWNFIHWAPVSWCSLSALVHFPDGSDQGTPWSCRLMYAVLRDIVAKQEQMGDEAWADLPSEFEFDELQVDYAKKDTGEAGRLVQSQFRAVAVSENPTPASLAFTANEAARGAAIKWYAANVATKSEEQLRTHLGDHFDAAQKHHATCEAIKWYAANVATKSEADLRAHLGVHFDAAQKHHTATVVACKEYSVMVTACKSEADIATAFADKGWTNLLAGVRNWYARNHQGAFQEMRSRVIQSVDEGCSMEEAHTKVETLRSSSTRVCLMIMQFFMGFNFASETRAILIR